MHEVPVDQLVEARGRLLQRHAGHGRQQLEVEAAAYDGGRHGTLLAGRGEHPEALLDRFGQAFRDVVRVAGQAPLSGRVHELLDVQRHAARSLENQLDQRGRGWARGEQLVHHPGGVLQVEPGQPGLLSEALEEHPRAPGTHGHLLMQLVAAQRADHQQRQRRQPAGKVPHHLQAELVAPVQVLERQQRGAVRGQGRQTVRRLQHKHPTPAVRIARIVDGLGEADEVTHQRATPVGHAGIR